MSRTCGPVDGAGHGSSCGRCLTSVAVYEPQPPPGAPRRKSGTGAKFVVAAVVGVFVLVGVVLVVLLRLFSAADRRVEESAARGGEALSFRVVQDTSPSPCEETPAPLDATAKVVARLGEQCLTLGPSALVARPGAEGTCRSHPLDSGFVLDVELADADIRPFDDLAAANAGRQLAVLIGDSVVSAPTLEAPGGFEGRLQITGRFSEQECDRLATALR